MPISMTTVGSIAGLRLATGTLNFEMIGWIVSWWVVTPIIGFWIGGTIGRYLYPELNRRFEIISLERPLLTLYRSGTVPTLTLGPNTTRRELVTTMMVLIIGCYMAFSAGASKSPTQSSLSSAGRIGGRYGDRHFDRCDWDRRFHDRPPNDGVCRN